MEESNPVKVAVKVRPLLPKEILSSATSCINTLFEKSQILIPPNKKFNFDYVFDEKCSQEQLHRTCIQPLLEKVIKGCNGTVLTYGQTNSGKSFTMGMDSTIENSGIIFPILNYLFTLASEQSNAHISIDISFIEIHNKEIYDLLSERKRIQIQEISNEVKLIDANVINVSSTNDALHWLKKGSSVRNTVSSTTYLQSNRSHAIFILYIHHNQNMSKLCLVDLAGSEITQSSSVSKEGIHVNLGLLALQNVMNSLNNKHEKMHKPYRNSLLTRVLKDCLNEETFSVLIACISSANICLKETMNTLRYALRARCVKDISFTPRRSNFTIFETNAANEENNENCSLTDMENKSLHHIHADISQPCSPGFQNEEIPILNKTLEEISNIAKQSNNESIKMVLSKNLRRKSQRLLEKNTNTKHQNELASHKISTNNFRKTQMKHNKTILNFLNNGTKDELQTLPFIGGKKALAIETYRNCHGPFGSLTELRQVQGFSEIPFKRFLKMNVITLD